jgi:hypothetical protein
MVLAVFMDRSFGSLLLSFSYVEVFQRLGFSCRSRILQGQTIMIVIDNSCGCGQVVLNYSLLRGIYGFPI